jgi:hypothetical protein
MSSALTLTASSADTRARWLAVYRTNQLAMLPQQTCPMKAARNDAYSSRYHVHDVYESNCSVHRRTAANKRLNSGSWCRGRYDVARLLPQLRMRAHDISSCAHLQAKTLQTALASMKQASAGMLK